MIHVVQALPEFAGPVPGNSRAPDEAIAEWCGLSNHVLVTTDEDFQGRWVRSGLLREHGVEVIVFDRDHKGLDEQHRQVTLHLPEWIAHLARNPYGFRVWEQPPRGAPRVREGRKRRPKSRPRPPVRTNP